MPLALRRPSPRHPLVLCLALALLAGAIAAQATHPTAPRRPNEGIGPFKKLLLKGAILIDGTGAPPRGPVDILVNGNRIASIGGEVAVDAERVLDVTGMYVLPGFIDMHAHAGGSSKAPDASYCYKLWLAHGVTTVRGVPLGPIAWTQPERERSARNEIVAPRIFDYQRPPETDTVDEARDWVRRMAKRGIDGLKLGAYRPEIMQALLDEARSQRLGSTAHLAQTGVARMNAMQAAQLGLGTVTHFYGHFEALLRDHVVQPWPATFNYADEQDRFREAARLWDRIFPPDSAEWHGYLEAHRNLGTVFEPTFAIYSANRDLMRARTAEWHADYSLPSLLDYFAPSRQSHGSYWFSWTTADEVAWRNFYRVWMQLTNDYKKLGGRVTCGSDSGFIWDTWGFGYIEELEMLQEAGFHPLEVIQCATLNGALTLHEPKGVPIEFGVVRKGLLADLVVVKENPLANVKVLYGTGWPRLDDATGKVERTTGIVWTIKDGIVYDAKQLLADVRAMVAEQKRRRTEGSRGGETPRESRSR